MGALFNTILQWIQIIKRRADHPRIEYEVDVQFIGKHKDFYFVELLGYINNVGLIAFELKPKDLNFELFALTPQNEVEYIDFSPNDTGEKDLIKDDPKEGRIKFPKLLLKKRWLPWKTYVEPNVQQRYSYNTTVPTDCSFLLLRGIFDYHGDKKFFHKVEKMVKVPMG